MDCRRGWRGVRVVVAILLAIALLALPGAAKGSGWPQERTPEVVSDYPIVDLPTDALLTTTRSVRRRLDLTKPVPIGLIRECLEIAVQAPTSSNVQNWSFLVVTDADQRRAIGDVYRRTWDWIVASAFAVADRFKDDPARNREQRKVSDSAAYLAEHIGEVPVLMIPCVEVIDGDGTLTGENANQYWSSIMPATWNYMLAARSRGLGTTWTGVTVMADEEMRAILGLPDNVYHATTIPTAYYTGTTFHPAARIPPDDIIHVDTW